VHKCDKAINDSANVIQCYTDLKEEQYFKNERFQFVTSTLEEFNEMLPANLDIMF
jgi:hypothetical protein